MGQGRPGVSTWPAAIIEALLEALGDSDAAVVEAAAGSLAQVALWPPPPGLARMLRSASFSLEPMAF